mmetsp:Transcript_616/g.795  ORF Transcript_616/g.795 Transcript_616/m.795 type:complete len:84 (+) Transcript_616:86-337(+)
MYLVTMTSFVMTFLPCNCIYALDSWGTKHPATVPKIVTVLIFLRLFLLVVYTYLNSFMEHFIWDTSSCDISTEQIHYYNMLIS